MYITLINGSNSSPEYTGNCHTFGCAYKRYSIEEGDEVVVEEINNGSEIPSPCRLPNCKRGVLLPEIYDLRHSNLQSSTDMAIKQLNSIPNYLYMPSTVCDTIPSHP